MRIKSVHPTTLDTDADCLHECRATYLHEAGHAVVALILGRQVTAIRIGDLGGGELTYLPVNVVSEEELLCADTIAMAGVLAEGYAMRLGAMRRREASARAGAAGDLANVHERGKPVRPRMLDDDALHRLECRAALAAGRLVRHNWQAIQFLADELVFASADDDVMAPTRIANTLRGLPLVDMAGRRLVVHAYRRGNAKYVRARSG